MGCFQAVADYSKLYQVKLHRIFYQDNDNRELSSCQDNPPNSLLLFDLGIMMRLITMLILFILFLPFFLQLLLDQLSKSQSNARKSGHSIRKTYPLMQTLALHSERCLRLCFPMLSFR